MEKELQAIRRRLESGAADIGTQGLAAVRSELAEAYASLPDDSLIAAMNRNIGAALSVLSSADGKPRTQDVDDIADAIHHRSTIGISSRDGMFAYRVCMRVISEAFTEIAVSRASSTKVALEGARRIWNLADEVLEAVNRKKRQEDVDHHLVESHTKSAFVLKLMSGTLAPPDVESLRDTFGISPDRPYLAFRARPSRLHSLEALRRRLEEDLKAMGALGLVGLAGNQCVGIASGVPPLRSGADIAMGPFLDLQSIGASFEIASRLLVRMEARDETGAYSLDDASWQLSVPKEPAIGSFLVRKYLGDLDQLGSLGESMVDTLRAYVTVNGDIGSAARALHVHTNTMRYRLAKYESHAGVEMRAPGILIEVAWALEFYDLESQKH